MASVQEIRNAKELGKHLRANRQKLGLSLLHVARQSGISIAKLNALESGNHYAFISSSIELFECANGYAKTLKIDIPIHLKPSFSNSAANTGVFIPYFLRKKE